MKKLTKADGVSIYYKSISSPLGLLHLLCTDQALIAVSTEKTWASFKKKWPNLIEKNHPILKATQVQLSEYFDGRRKDFDLPLQTDGTAFQKSVWRSLKKIPFGKTLSYKSQSQALGKPLAVRAVAQANGRNPIAIIIPCHRVIGSSGKLVGYAGGLEIKQKLLEIEKLGA